ncbi:MAG: response regulator [Nitrospinae bacterium]|nr:response regulator [Nitrospinota bacterium]
MNENEMRILIVDDCEEIRLLMEDLLRMDGYEKIDLAENGSEALEKIMEMERAGEIYSLVITDLEMPVMGGLELIKSVRNRKCGIPILVMSGSMDAELKERIMNSGINGFMRKPVNFRDFKETVRGLLFQI